MTPEIFSSDPSWPYTKAKTAVLTAAAAVIREEGPRSATLKNIATRAGITEPAIFRHFDGVDGLFGGLFSVYELLGARMAKAFSEGGSAIERLRKASASIVDTLASSEDFSYLLVYARHVFRGYPELKAKAIERESAEQGRFLACINEAAKDGDIRSDIDAASAAISLLGTVHLLASTWIEAGFGFDLRAAFADRWEDFERMSSIKPAVKSRDAKAAVRERSAAFFPLRLAQGSRAKAAASRKAPAKPEAGRRQKAPKALEKAAPKAARVASKASRAAKSAAKKPTTRTK